VKTTEKVRMERIVVVKLVIILKTTINVKVDQIVRVIVNETVVVIKIKVRIAAAKKRKTERIAIVGAVEAGVVDIKARVVDIKAKIVDVARVVSV
jgi:hypothetical protein